MAKILVTGANGFVGKRLALYLLEQGHEVYALCRIKGAKVFGDEDIKGLYYIWGDLRNSETIQSIPKEIEAAYYLVHSMSDIVSNLVESECEVLKQFLKCLEPTNVKQIIYLSGIVNDENNLSTHLKSRLLVEKALMSSRYPTTVLRASIIIGAGSASFEIVRDLCEKLPIMIAPKWVKSKCQPIAIADVLYYLSNVLLKPEAYNRVFDIGGPDVLTFKELMLRYAAFRNLKRWIIDVPVLTPRLSSYWLVFITSVRFSLCSYLVESMKSDTVVEKKGINSLLPHDCLKYEDALQLAFQKISQNEITSSWMDSWDILGNDPNIEDYIQVPTEGCLKDIKIAEIRDSKQEALERIWSIGGAKGYYAYDWAWGLRGLIDKFAGGVGLNRGRSHPTQLRAGDAVDFWRVILADKPNCHLILFAGMKVPGEAWLEFELKEEGSTCNLVQTATFRPKGVLGRLYWFLLMPIHFFLFRKMAKAIAGRTKTTLLNNQTH